MSRHWVFLEARIEMYYTKHQGEEKGEGKKKRGEAVGDGEKEEAVGGPASGADGTFFCGPRKQGKRGPYRGEEDHQRRTGDNTHCVTWWGEARKASAPIMKDPRGVKQKSMAVSKDKAPESMGEEGGGRGGKKGGRGAAGNEAAETG